MKKKFNYCCERFEVNVDEGEIRHSSANIDETEWYTSFGHLYYCPFCGEFIMGNGYGKPLKSRWKNNKHAL